MLFLFSGQSLAEQDGFRHFTVAPVLLSSDATYTISGTRSATIDADVERNVAPKDAIWTSPIQPEDADCYAVMLHACAHLYLTTGQIGAAYGQTSEQRKNFRRMSNIVLKYVTASCGIIGGGVREKGCRARWWLRPDLG